MLRRASLVLALVLAACAPNNVTGDSISVPIASNALYFVDASGGRTVFNPGHRPGALNGVESVRALAGRTKPGDWMIVELGTNDVTNPISGMAARVQAVVDAVPAHVCLAFVTIWRAQEVYQTRITEWNRQVRARVKQRACRAIIDWNLAARAFPSLMSADRVHPSPAGTRWLRDEYTRVSNLPAGAYA